MDYLEYKGYKGTVEYSKEDNCLFGKVIGMSQDVILYEGQTLDELRSDFEAGIDDYIAGCIAEGVEPRKPFSGRLNLRMPSELHARVASLANSTGTTINDFINKAIIHILIFLLIQSSKVGIKTKKVKAFDKKNLYFPYSFTNRIDYPLYSSDTVSFALPFARRAANTRRPLAVAILERNPCLFFLFLLDGWNVLFISLYDFIYYYSHTYSGCKDRFFF